VVLLQGNAHGVNFRLLIFPELLDIFFSFRRKSKRTKSQAAKKKQLLAAWLSYPFMRKTPGETIQTKIDLAHPIVLALKRTASRETEQKQFDLKALAYRIKLCNSAKNFWIAENAESADGEYYTAVGRFWLCGSRLCPACAAAAAARSRRKLRKAISEQKLERGERFYFPTLTIQNPNLSLLKTRLIVNYAWTLLRKRRFWCASIRGGSKSEEFTKTARGFHYHLHLFIKSKYLHFQEFRRVWTECVEQSFKKFHVDFNPGTIDGLLIVRFEPINDLESIVFELCKYLTKSDSWSKIPESDLSDLALLPRWHRMFEMFGSFRSNEKRREDEPIVHKTVLSDAALRDTSIPTWLRRARKLGMFRYLADLEADFKKSESYRRDQLYRRWRFSSVFSYRTLKFHENLLQI
jgi:hypothetical protein